MATPIIDADFVVYRLEEAGRTLLALPGTGCAPAGYGNGWPAVVREHIEAYGWETAQNRPATPNADCITRMDEALGWIVHIKLTTAHPGAADQFSQHGGAFKRKLVLMRALVHPITERHQWSWRRIGKQYGVSHEAVRQWHGRAIDEIVKAIRQKCQPRQFISVDETKKKAA
jgi:hypothetical protein